MFAALPAASAATVARFSLHADTDPGTLPRVIELFAKRGLVPTRLLSRATPDGLELEVRMRDLDPDLARVVAAQMQAIPLVRDVRWVVVADRDSPDR